MNSFLYFVGNFLILKMDRYDSVNPMADRIKKAGRGPIPGKNRFLKK